MDKQIDNTPALSIIVTGWLITILILLFVDPELTRNEFLHLLAFYGIFSNNLKGD